MYKISCIWLLILMLGSVQGNFEELTGLSVYQITNSTDVIPRRIKSLAGNEKSLQIKAFGNVFIVDLDVYFPREDVGVYYISELRNTSNTFLGDESEHQLYYGYVRGIENSYAIGFLSDGKYFKGYIFTEEVAYCVEPYGDEGSLIVYRFKDVIFPGCSNMFGGERFDCNETRYFDPWKAKEPPANKLRSNFKFDNSSETGVQIGNDTEFRHEKNKSDVEASKEKLLELQCDVEIVVGPSLIDRFGGNNDNVLKDIYTQLSVLNMILRKVTYSKGNESFHITLNVENIVLYGDEVYSPFAEDSDLEYFTKVHQPTEKVCLTIGLVNKYLRSGNLFDGYIPETGGGACAESGNTILVSYGNEGSPLPTAMNLASLIRAVTRALGANDRDPECEVGTYPNPMTVLQDYLLNKTITIPKQFSIITECNVREIVKTVGKMKGCFTNILDPLCGNGIVDEGEECDCGPAYSCDAIDPCCNPPVRNDTKSQKEKGCTLIEGAECALSQECCSSNCEIQKEKNVVCFNGNDVCDTAMCDANSADCPSGVEASDGMVCSEYKEATFEPTLCINTKCDKPLCTGNGLQPCTCARGTAKECSYCCIKDGECKTAGSELQLMKGRDFFLPNGAECTGGNCLNGKCVNDMKQVVNYTSPPTTTFKDKEENGTVEDLLRLRLLSPL